MLALIVIQQILHSLKSFRSIFSHRRSLFIFLQRTIINKLHYRIYVFYIIILIVERVSSFNFVYKTQTYSSFILEHTSIEVSREISNFIKKKSIYAFPLGTHELLIMLYKLTMVGSNRKRSLPSIRIIGNQKAKFTRRR